MGKGLKDDMKTENQIVGQDNDSFRVFWKNGINMEVPDKSVSFKLGARIMNDWTFTSPDEKLVDTLGEFSDGTEIRRAWIQASGVVSSNIEFNSLYGLEGGDVDILDLYIGVRSIPAVGNIWVGHFKEPIGFEQRPLRESFLDRSHR